MTKSATAFAPSRTKGGQSIGWESILNTPEPQAPNVLFPNAIRAAAGFSTLSRALIPENVTRGVVTLERVRGWFNVYYRSLELAAAFINWPISVAMMLVPVQNGAFIPQGVLSPFNAADQESNKILWQRLYYPNSGTTITGPGALEYHTSVGAEIPVDVKVKRRFDRALWALHLVCDIETGGIALHRVGGTMRAIFRTSDGI